jgi:hypothetical protein
MRRTGIGKDRRRGDRAQQGRVGRVVVVGIVRFQNGEGVEVEKSRDWFGGDYPVLLRPTSRETPGEFFFFWKV